MNADEDMAKTKQQRPQPELGLNWIKSSARFLSAFISVYLRLKGAFRLGQKRHTDGRGAEKAALGDGKAERATIWEAYFPTAKRTILWVPPFLFLGRASKPGSIAGGNQ
jgi:hypothetical protein